VADGTALVLDFDGTLTERDTLEILVERFGDLDARNERERRLGAELTLRELIAANVASLSVSQERALATLDQETRLRKGLGRLLEWARGHDVEVLVVSSGMRAIVEHILARAGAEHVRVVANECEIDGQSWRVRFSDAAMCPECGESCKRAAVTKLAGGRTVVYVGDGYSDLFAALAADRVFARRRLAALLSELAVSYTPFEDMDDVSAVLESDGGFAGRAS
jgi:2-hydroxy-3-keto-5-methylthiopentenyl-1-phosphate phosphatase